MSSRSIREGNIPLAISQIRADNRLPVVSDHVEGNNSQVFKVDFPDGESWDVKIPVSLHTTNLQSISFLVEAEACVLKELETKEFRWSPKLHGYNSTFDNPIGHPFIAMSWISGRQLGWTDDCPEESVRDKILVQVAEIQTSLIECTKDTGDTSATDHFAKIIKNKFDRIRSGNLLELTEQDVAEQLDLLPGVVLTELDNVPFAIDHGNLGPHNIIIDEQHNIVGIIDWILAAKVPFQQAACFPDLLRLNDFSKPASAIMKNDRATYTAIIRSKRSESVEWFTPVICAEDTEFRTLFLDSIRSKSVHRDMAQAGWRAAPIFC